VNNATLKVAGYTMPQIGDDQEKEA